MGGPLTKLLHFSDLHLGIEAHGRPDPATGINQRVLDVAARLDEIVDYALGNEVDLVLFAGDAFKNATPHPTLQKMLAERVRRLTREGVRMFFLAGNHDLPRMAANVTAFSVYSALEAEHVWIADKPGVYRIPLRNGEIQVAAIPHFWPRALAEQLRANGTDVDPDNISHQVVSAKVKELAKDIDPAIPAVLTAHLEVKGAKKSDSQDRYDTTEVRVAPAALANAAFPYVALGHIHDRLPVLDRGDVFIRYSGSVERMDFGEEGEEKGFYVVTYDGVRVAGEPEFVALHPRPFVTIDTGVGEGDATGSVLASVGKFDVAEAIVRVRVRAARELFASVDSKRIHEALQGAYEASLLCVPPEDAPEVGRDPRFAEQMSEKNALAEYVRSAYPKDADALVALGNDVIDEVLAEA